MQYSSIITLWKRKITREAIIFKAVAKKCFYKTRCGVELEALCAHL